MNPEIKQEHTLKSHINGFLIFLTVMLYIADFVFLVAIASSDMEVLIGVGAIPVIGIILVSPNVVLHEIKKAKKLKGNQHVKNLPVDRMNGRYPVYTFPTDYGKKLFWFIVRDRFLNGVVLVAAFIGGIIISSGHLDSSFAKVSGAAGLTVFSILIFGFPVLAYFITHAILQMRAVRHNEFEAYHTVLSRADYRYIYVGHVKYEYCICVGIRRSKIKNTPVTMIFVLDETYIIPDPKEPYKPIR